MFSYIGTRWFVGLALLGVLDAVWIYLAGYSVDAFSFWYCVAQALACLIALVLFNWGLDAARAREGWKWQGNAIATFTFLSRFAEAMTFFALGWIALRLFNHLSMATSIPYADQMLARWDAALFGYWHDYFVYIATSPIWMELLDLAYDGLTPLSFLAFCLLFLNGKQQHARFFVLTFSTTAVLATTIGMLFPAKAAVATLLTQPELLDDFRTRPGVYSIDIIAALKTRTDIVFDLENLPGLTTFPSFHTGAGVLMLYAFRRTMFFWPGGLYVAFMIAATPVYGGHYFIDIVAGTALALAVCYGFERQPQFRDTFKRTRRVVGAKEPVPSAIAISSERV